MTNQITIGMSGHIDHGKTSVVRSLTGINTDILIQEKKRGMTIDIGFAHLSNEITIIDVPGHEKFIKNMVTGVSYIDFALLVVAADDGVMPQTREHFEILKILNIKNGAIVINKIDLVDDEWLELVEFDVKDLVKDSFLENKAIFKVSAKNEEGFSSLKKHLYKIQSNNKINSNDDIFRMYVDRSFKQPGFGTIVTGTVISGEAQIGENLIVMPKNKTGRLRSVQSHNQDVKIVSFGNRAAINLHNIDLSDVKRGAHLSNKDIFSAKTKFLAKITSLEKNKFLIKQNQRLRFHIGPNEIIGRISIAESNRIKAGESKMCMVNLEKPVTISYMDKFLIRSFSPIRTLGGGEVFDIDVTGKWKDIKNYAINLKKKINDSERMMSIIESQKKYPFTTNEIERRLGQSLKNITKKIGPKKKYSIINFLSFEWILTEKQIFEYNRKLLNVVEEFHKQNPYNQGILKIVLLQKNGGDENFLDYSINHLIEKKKLEKIDEFIKIKDFKINLSENENILMDKILSAINLQGFESDTSEELALKFKADVEKIKLLLGIAEKNNAIIRLNEDLFFTRSNFERLISDLKIFFKQNEHMSVADFKNIVKTTRKYAMPILEHLDKSKITIRIDNYRKLL